MSLGFKTFEWINLPFQEIQTEEGQTRYYLVGDQKLPSMTSILGILEDGTIDDWRDAVGHEEADRIVSEAIKRGNSLHEISELYLKNELTRDLIKGPGALLFNRSKKHLDELGPIVAIEVPLYNLKMKYAGRVDCIAFHKGDLCIVDHKNSRTPIDIKKDYGRKKLFKYLLQMQGYRAAFKEMFPSFPEPTHGILIVGNFKTMNSTMFKYKLDAMEKEFDLLIQSYYGNADIKESAYYQL